MSDKILLKKKSGSALLMAVMILAGILTAVLGSAAIIIPGLKATRTQGDSTRAYFAAEAGMERALYGDRKQASDFSACLDSGECLDFSSSTLTCGLCSSTEMVLGNDAVYRVEFASSSPYLIFTSFGSFGGYSRVLEASFLASGTDAYVCVPNCTGQLCGADDGCGGACPASCITIPGCSNIQPSNTVVAPGSCCSGGCYDCKDGYIWDGNKCVGMIAYWKMDGDWTDSIGNNHGSASGAIFGEPRHGLNSGFFDGINDYISTPGSDIYKFSSFTLEAWIKTPDAGNGRRRIVSQQGTISNRYWGMNLSNNVLELISHLDGPMLISHGPALNDNVWHHVVVVRDTINMLAIWYVDGENVGQETIISTASFNITATEPTSGPASVQIGRFIYGGIDPYPYENYSGFIDEVAVYNRALSADEILNRYMGL